MQAQRRRAGSTRTTARGVPPSSRLSETLPQSLLSRLDPFAAPEHLERIDSYTMTGRLSGERLA